MSKVEKKKYKKFIKKYRKIFIKQAKVTEPYDFNYLYLIIRNQLEFMYKYYKNGINVYQANYTKEKILETLGDCINICDSLDTLYRESDSDAEENDKLESKLFKELFDIIGENIQSWWD